MPIADIQNALENIYISPLESCNLNCKLCYTAKTKNTLTNHQILSFTKRYRDFLKTFRSHQFFSDIQRGNTLAGGKKFGDKESLSLKSILFCGGEVFTLKNFPRLINTLHSQSIFTTIITNGTIDQLKKIKQPQNCQLLVSLDGPKEIHDKNRGNGNFDKTIKFINHALKLKFPVEIMYLITPESYPYLDSFGTVLNRSLQINYITQKTYFYTANHPLCNQHNTVPALTPQQIINLKQHYRSLPPKNFGCFQLSLQSDGQIYGCCESPYPLAKISTPISKTIKEFTKTLIHCTKCGHCSGCCVPEFLCGYRQELMLKSCRDIVKHFNN